MKNDELQVIEQLTGISPDQIKLADDGFWSRGYVIDNGRIVFKFRKSPEVKYETEIKALDFINSLDLGINVQKVGWISPDDGYLGVYGVLGRSLEADLNYNRGEIGRQLALALEKLHSAHPNDAEVVALNDEISAWQRRYQKSRDELAKYFSEAELERFDNFMLKVLPARLSRLGEKLVFSHGDLGDGNIFVDGDGRVGIIDFSEMCYLDEAADFMDVSDDKLRAAMLDAYGADEILREKVGLRVLVRPLFVLGDYINRGDNAKNKELVSKIKKNLEEEYGRI